MSRRIGYGMVNERGLIKRWVVPRAKVSTRWEAKPGKEEGRKVQSIGPVYPKKSKNGNGKGS